MVPKVRFKGFTDEWEQHKLEEIAEFYNGDRGPNYPKPSEIVEQGVPFINAGDLINGHIDYRNCKHITSDKFNQLNGAKLKINDIVYCLRGTIGKNGLVNSDANATIASSLVCIRPVKLRPLFLFQILNSSIEERQRKMVDEGAAQPNISATNLKKFLIPVPNDNEQEKIGEVFSKLNHLITLQQHKLDQLNTLKKGLLQKMFADKKHPKPELRFKGFSGDWEQRKLGDIAPLRGGFAFKSSKFRNTGVPIVRISNILSSGEIGGDFVYYDEQDKDDKYILPDKSAVLAMSGATTGKVAILSQTDYDKVYQNQRVGYFQPVDYIDYGFISTIVRSELFMMQLESVLVSGAQPNVSSKEIDSFNFMIPILVQEQQKIGSFFKQLDHLITLQQKQIDKLNSLKKSLLQNMFI